MPHLGEGFDGHGSIANPAETVVPVAYLTDGFGQTGGKRCQDGTGIFVAHEFECEQATRH